MKRPGLFILCFPLLLLAPFSQSYSKEHLIVKEPLKQTRFVIQNRAINESSGLACSTRNKHLLWSHNDSGHMPIIYALTTAGKDRGTYFIEDVESIDWEDMDAFEYQGRHYLLVADTGDNFKILWEHRIIFLEEPIPGEKPHPTLSPAWSVIYRYKNGLSYNVEAAGVDLKRQKIILLSKHHKPTLMFELPLKPEDPDKVQLARKIAELPEIKHPSAIDFSADGETMSINTYRRIHRYSRKNPADSWHYQYSIKYKPMFQPEAMCLSKNSKNYYITSEKRFDLLKVKLK